MTLDDLASSVLGQLLTRPMETTAARDLCSALLRLNLTARGSEFVVAVCALVETATSGFEPDRQPPTAEGIRRVESWIAQRRWISDRIADASVRVPLTPAARQRLDHFRSRTAHLAGAAAAAWPQVPVRVQPMTPLRPRRSLTAPRRTD